MKGHVVWAGSHRWEGDKPPEKPTDHAKEIEPWLAALLQAEHLGLLVGSGLTAAIASRVGVPALDMKAAWPQCRMADVIQRAAEDSARRCGRGEANIEDQIRAIVNLVTGLEVIRRGFDARLSRSRTAKSAIALLEEWETALGQQLGVFLGRVMETERALRHAFETDPDNGGTALHFLGSFLLTFASRAASRERLHIFTTNYDRLVEYGCDHLGLRVLDRFVGGLLPVFRSSRLGVDLHYNPPGIRGEPRYLEGVVRLTKLHGSIDWRVERDPSGLPRIVRQGIPFGAGTDNWGGATLRNALVIYPHPAKDTETLEFPYAELFRDFAAAICQPNAVLVTYGYGFGDDHINRVIRDMLTIPSAHLAIISYGDPGGRIQRFCDAVRRNEQITLLLGSHFGDIGELVHYYLPKPAIDLFTLKKVDLQNRRIVNKPPGSDDKEHDQPEV